MLQPGPGHAEVIGDTEVPTVINDVRYTLHSRVVQQPDGSRHKQYRVLLNGEIIKPWTEGDILPYFLPEQRDMHS